MELSLPPSVTTTTTTATTIFSTTSKFSFKRLKTCLCRSNLFRELKSKKKSINNPFSALVNPAFSTDKLFSLSSSSTSICSLHLYTTRSTTSSSTESTLTASSSGQNHHWMVIMDSPPQGFNSKPEIIDYYVKTLQSVLGSEKEAQMSIYDASWDTHFAFCCDIDEETSLELARLPAVLSVKPTPGYGSAQKDCSSSEVPLGPLSTMISGSNNLFPSGNSKHWLVRMDKLEIGVVSRSQMVDYYTQVLTKVMGNNKDAQMCIYHISWQSNFGFCCELDEECARELADLPGVLSVQLDENFESTNKDYGGKNMQKFGYSSDPSANKTTNIKTKKLFVTGLSFYTSEKTLRAAFEIFGELVEVKIIMDKISKRSKGYAFVEYTTEAAAAAALKEMNGKIINGWMITVDVAKSNPPKYSRGRPRPAI